MNPEELAEFKISVRLIAGYSDTAVADSTIALMWASAPFLAQMRFSFKRWRRRQEIPQNVDSTSCEPLFDGLHDLYKIPV